MKKFWENRNLVRIPAFEATGHKNFVLSIMIHQKTYLTNTTASICCYSNNKMRKFQKIFECVFFT